MNHLSSSYIKGRFTFNADEWPPYHPKHYTTLALIHHKGRRSDQRIISQELVSQGMLPGTIKAYQTKEDYKSFIIGISNLFSYCFEASSGSTFILIEGAPGIGKTVLSKEIACQWAMKKLLSSKKLVFLLHLRDPNLQDMHVIKDLVQYIFGHDKLESSVAEYLFNTSGNGLVVILDGYDEMSEENRKRSFIARIINRKVLPECDLVITSRPTASVHLRDIASCRVEVLGFTEENRLDYIKHALKGSSDKVSALQSYLQSNSIINALCYIPLNMTILLCLYEEEGGMSNNPQTDCTQKLGNLPTTQTEMYRKFILMTINRSLRKEKPPSDGIFLNEVSNLSIPDNKIFTDLCQLAFNALKLDKLVFEFDEVKKICPNLTVAPGSWSGLGLLNAVRFVTNVSFHFLHFSIQEYLAAYHISSLSNSEQLKLLKETFWEIRYFNAWIMYVGITRGKRFAWRHFVSGNWFRVSTWIFGTSKISKKLLIDKVRCLHLFQCYTEIGGHEAIEKLFDGQVIDLSNQTLLPKDLNTLGFFLLRSNNNKHWKKLNLAHCNIGDVGCNVLHQQFWNKGTRQIVNIKYVDFSHNQLHGPSILALLDVFKAWNVMEAVINDDYIGEGDKYQFETFLNKFSGPVDEKQSQILSLGPYLYAIKSKQKQLHHYLSNSTEYEGLYLKDFEQDLTDFRMEELSIAIAKHKLHKIHIIGNALTRFVMQGIVTNVSSVFVCDYTLSDDYLDNIAVLLHCAPSACNWLLVGRNKTLGYIAGQNERLPMYVSTITLLELLVNARNVHVKPVFFTTECKLQSALYDDKCAFQEIMQSWQSKQFKGQTSICLLERNVLIANRVSFRDISEVLKAHKHLHSIFISSCYMSASIFTDLVSEQHLLSVLYIFDCCLEAEFLEEVCLAYSTKKPQLKELFVHTTYTFHSLTVSLLSLLTTHCNNSTMLLTRDTLVCQRPTSEQIILALQLEPTITIWKFCGRLLSTETFYIIVSHLSSNASNLVEMDVSACNLGECELEIFSTCLLKGNKVDLKALSLSCRDTGKTATALASILSAANKLEELDLRLDNYLYLEGIIKIFNALVESKCSLKSFKISCNNINNKAAIHIGAILSRSTTLHTIGFSGNWLQAEGIAEILKGMSNISLVEQLSFINNIYNSTFDVVNLAGVLSRYDKLKELNLSCNCLHTEDAIGIFKNAHVITLKKLNISDNNISEKAADSIAVFLSKNAQLEEIDLNNNNLRELGTLKLLSITKGLPFLRNIKVCCNNIDYRAADNIGTLFDQSSEERKQYSRYSILKTKNKFEIISAVENLSTLTSVAVVQNFDCNYHLTSGVAIILSCDVTLDTSCNILQAVDIIKSLRSIEHLSKLSKIFITHSQISDQGSVDLAIVLSRNINLKELVLSYDNLRTAKAKTVFQGMKKMLGLKHINVSYNNITREAASIIANVLSHNNQIEEIDLRCNSLQAIGIMEILNRLKYTSNLKRLYIANNYISDEAVDDIIGVVSHSPALEEIDLSFNKLPNMCALKIFQATKSNPNIKMINFSHNNVTDEVAAEVITTFSEKGELECGKRPAEVLSAVERRSRLVNIILSSNCCNTGQTGDSCLILVILPCDICLDIQAMELLNFLKAANNLETLTKLCISHSHITDEAAGDLAVVLSCNDKLQELTLSYNNICTENSIVLFQGMKNFCNLTFVDISHNNIDQEAAYYLSNVLSRNAELLHLDLSNNNFQLVGFAEILKGIKSVVVLNFSSNSIASITTDITDCLSRNSKLKELDLSYNSIQDTDSIEIFKGINSIKTLQRLNISHNNITDEAAKDIAAALSQRNKPVDLDLSSNNFHAVFAETLGRMRFVKTLNLSNTSMAIDNIVGCLPYYSALEELDLSYNSIQSADAIEIFKGIESIATLQRLDISHNNITDVAAEDIVAALSQHHELKTVDLSWNNLESAGLKLLKVIDIVLMKQFSIDITDEAVDEFVSTLYHKTKGHAANSEDILSSIDELDEEMDLLIPLIPHKTKDSATNFKEIEIFRATKKSTNLVNYTDYYIDKNGMVVILSSDIASDLSYKQIRVKELLQLFKTMNIENITRFQISHSVVTADSLSILSYNIKLEELVLSHNKVSVPATTVWWQEMLHLVSINISCNEIDPKASNQLFTVLSYSPNLENLDLSYNNLLVKDIINVSKKLKNTVSLKKFSMRDNSLHNKALVAIVTVLSCNTNLEELDLDCSSLGNDSVGAVLNKITNIPFLKMVNIATDEKLVCNAVVEKDKSCLMSLSIRHKCWEETTFLSKHAKHVMSHHTMTMEILKIFTVNQNTTHLKKLHITGDIITNTVADSLADILSHNIKLEEFNLHVNDVQNATVIFIGMKSMSSLVNFDISGCNITSEAEESICDVLLNNQKLRELDLSYSSLPASIFLKLQSVTNLVKLNIRCMNITDEGADDIATFLSHNDKLREFDISHNRLQSEGTIKIFKGMQNIFTLNKVDVSYNMITDKAADIIAAVLSQNNNLKHLYLVAVNMHLEGLGKISKSIAHIPLNACF